MSGKAQETELQEGASGADDDEAFEALEQKDVTPVVHETVVKKGNMAPPPAIAGGKRKRDAILTELKAARKAAAEAAAASQPQLGSHFRKITSEPRIEVDEHGREVLIVVGKDGKVKRKVRKPKGGNTTEDGSSGLLEVDKTAKPLGINDAELPKFATPVPSKDYRVDEDDIFEGVGTDYDPLAALGDEDDDEDEDEEGLIKEDQNQSDDASKNGITKAATSGSRNYFNDSAPAESVFEKPDNATVMATLKKASLIAEKAGPSPHSEAAADDEERLKRRAAMLASRDRDMDDIDMGFGSNRFDDAEEAEGDERIKLSEWKGMTGEDEAADDQTARGGKKRKRGPKKKKGDKDSAADVLKVLERRAAV